MPKFIGLRVATSVVTRAKGSLIDLLAASRSLDGYIKKVALCTTVPFGPHDGIEVSISTAPHDTVHNEIAATPEPLVPKGINIPDDPLQWQRLWREAEHDIGSQGQSMGLPLKASVEAAQALGCERESRQHGVQLAIWARALEKQAE